MNHREPMRTRKAIALLASLVTALVCASGQGWTQSKVDRDFQVVLTDDKGMETELKRFRFYWEEKVSETAFVPHELKEVPVRRGAATVNVKFEHVRQIEVKPSADGGMLVFTITLLNGKTGDFPLAIAGSFKGDSDFGEVEVPAKGLRKLVFK